jgi:hypothetical protein
MFTMVSDVHVEVHTVVLTCLRQDPSGVQWMRATDSTPDRDGRSRESRTAVLPILMRWANRQKM